jgi:hypothetical protein
MMPNDPAQEPEVQSLSDTITDTPPNAPDAAPEPETPPQPPISNQQILGMTAMFSSFGLPPEVAESYRKDLTEDFMLQMFLEMSGLASGLAEYGIGGSGGSMPAWMKVVLGTAALGFFVWQKRAKYGSINQEPAPVAAGAGNTGFAGAWGFGQQPQETTYENPVGQP